MTGKPPLRVQLNPDIGDAPPASDEITLYDEEHLIVYLRLLDAAAAGADWRDVVRLVLQRDPEADHERARQCWERHLARAKWMTTNGYKKLLEDATAECPDRIHIQ